MLRISLMALALALAVPAAQAQNFLFLHKSEGFEHSPIAFKDGKTYAGNVMQKLAQTHGVSFTETKNASTINAENLKNYDLVILYTSGDPTKPSKDGGDQMGPNGQAELLEWVKNGGAVMAFHSTTDTFHTPPAGEVTPFVNMLGAEFVGHGKQFVGAVKVVDKGHPAIAAIPDDWQINEEWYTFKNFNKKDMHVLALLDTTSERSKQEMYDVPNYPVIWVSQYGNGKVYFSALGHGEEMWDNPTFQQSIVDAATWLLDEYSSPNDTKPNYEEVVPKEK